MYPIIHLFGREIGIYGITTALGLVACILCVLFLHRRRPEETDQYMLIYCSLVLLVGLFLGAHLLYGITMLPHIIRNIRTITSWSTFVDFFSLYFGGMVFYGGLFGGMIAGYCYLRVRKQPRAGYADLFAVCIPLFHGFGRIGCFFGGCCYGIESSFGFTYTHSMVPAADGVSRFPVQLLESACNFLLFFLLLYFYRKGKMRGRLLLCYFSVYPVVRFCDEFLRGDKIRGIFWGLSTSQWISLAILITVSVLWIVRIRRSKKSVLSNPLQ